MRKLILAATVAGATMAGSANSAELTGSIWFPDTHPLTSAGYLDWAKQVNEASGGDLSIRVFTGTALLPAGAHLSGLRDGIAGLTYHAGTYTPSDLPEDNVLAVLGIGLEDNIVIAAAVTDFYMNDPGMKAMFDRHGLVFLSGYATPPYILMCTSKVESLADIRGKRIRMPGAIHAQFADRIGAVAVSVPSTEMFTGLERGQLDCAANAANDLRSRSLWDVAKHVTTIDLGSYFSGWHHAANADSWAGLSDEQRRIILDTLTDAVVNSTIEYTRTSEASLAEAPDHGVTIYEPSADLQGALDEFNQNEVAQIAVGEGTNVFNMQGTEELIERFQGAVQKWRGLYEGVDRTDADALRTILYDNLYSQVDESSYGL
ncbi:C4-dicarboxylate ABC transporter [Aureimonas fodinaquatilis]|uniref:C4-dicarboxylate ABC transporter n=1 Tax=Aureimonas fodinaquatilis TaxID=2565783 RepID=A0A5B0DYW2_9HYPH|nr:C4-dicarboxylate TRAP transporter substrate-binding protein [Aureimonas fodinaquatilis]KAA0972007.1 C4-dicarboxylate ABC transporter [Aureimonas fodinaquatilis]